jgi:hypothetical protein
MQFPFSSEGVTHIKPLIAFFKQYGRDSYFESDMTVYVHDAEDIDLFSMITAQY